MVLLEVIRKIYWTLFHFFNEKIAEDDFLAFMKALALLALVEYTLVRLVTNLLNFVGFISIKDFNYDVVIYALFFPFNLFFVIKEKDRKKSTYNSSKLFVCIIGLFVLLMISFKAVDF